MSKRDLELFLFGILVAIVKIKKSVSHFNNPNDLKHDYLSWDSVMREFQIIEELQSLDPLVQSPDSFVSLVSFIKKTRFKSFVVN